MTPNGDIVVLGLGNPVMGDEGIGIRLLEELERRSGEMPGVDFIEIGTRGMVVLHAMLGCKKAVFLDCAFLGEYPGAIRRFTPDEVISCKYQSYLSLHEGDILGVIEIARRLEQCPEDVVIFGIQPESMEPGDSHLSKTLEDLMPSYVAAVMKDILGKKE